LTERARALNGQIAELEAQIRRLAAAQTKALESARSSPACVHGHPHGQTVAAPSAPPPSREPIFEELDQDRLDSEPESAPEHRNELGVRKYDLAAGWQRLKIISGTGGGESQTGQLPGRRQHSGLRPLRYEKRVARNRFLLLVAILVLVLWGLFAAFIRNKIGSCLRRLWFVGSHRRLGLVLILGIAAIMFFWRGDK